MLPKNILDKIKNFFLKTLATELLCILSNKIGIKFHILEFLNRFCKGFACQFVKKYPGTLSNSMAIIRPIGNHGIKHAAFPISNDGCTAHLCFYGNDTEIFFAWKN